MDDRPGGGPLAPPGLEHTGSRRQEWGENHACRRIVLEMQPKNYPAIHMAQKMGFDLCGYNDLYYTNHDIALFLTSRALESEITYILRKGFQDSVVVVDYWLTALCIRC
jgi:hypothetical protein